MCKTKTLRSQQTDAEQRLWYFLRGHRFLELKFKRQKPVGPYIVDFICHESNLIVELDGGQHAEQLGYDAQRTAFLNAQGFRVLRFWNNEVLQQTEAVLEAIRQAALSPDPSPASGRGEEHQALAHTPAPAGEGRKLTATGQREITPTTALTGSPLSRTRERVAAGRERARKPDHE